MSQIAVTVNGQSGPNVTATTGDTISVSVSPSGSPGGQGATGPAGPASSLTIGTVTKGDTASATITGSAPNQTLSLVLPKGDAGPQGASGPSGPAASLTIGTVTSGSTAAANITGSAPNQTLSLVLPVGAVGATGPAGPVGPAGPPGALSDETPQPLGTASAGTALAAARADHIHAVPAIAYSSLSGLPSNFPSNIASVSGLQAALDGKQPVGNYATLVGGTVPSSQLPSYVDDVIEAANIAAFAATGEVGKIYVARDTNKTYRWSGSAYVEISASPGSTDAVAEGSVNLYHTTKRAADAAPVQSVAGRTGAVTLTKTDVGLGNVSNVDATARSSHTGTQAISTVDGLQAAIDAKLASAVTTLNSLSGAVTLEAGSNVTLSTSGSKITIASSGGGGGGGGGGSGSTSLVYAATPAGFPGAGSADNMYIATDVQRVYRWDASNGVYVELGPG